MAARSPTCSFAAVYSLEHVLWIGGPGGAGKTTVATHLVRRHGLRWHSADARTWAHRDRALRDGVAAAHRWEALPPDERWRASPDEMVAMSLHSERGPMVVEDLRALPAAPLVVAEGTTLPPAVVSSGIALRSRAVWLLPTRELQRTRLEERAFARGPRELYLRLAGTIERDVHVHGAPFLRVDGTASIDETVGAVEALFAEALAAGPCAATRAERRALLREGNDAHVTQVRSYYARPWADGDADAVVRTFLCECGDRTCVASVDCTVESAADGPVLAAGHGST